jgi:hypothetical protein
MLVYLVLGMIVVKIMGVIESRYKIPGLVSR